MKRQLLILVEESEVSDVKHHYSTLQNLEVTLQVVVCGFKRCKKCQNVTLFLPMFAAIS